MDLILPLDIMRQKQLSESFPPLHGGASSPVPDLLFLDEATASVDRKNSEIVAEIILKMKKGGKPTVIMTTNDAEQAERLADFLICMDEGSLRLPVCLK